MKPLTALLCVAVLASCSKTTDLSGSGFVLETPNAEMRKAMLKIDRPFAETVAVNRETCLKLPGCRK
jgi:hypothetical protein